jgi:ATP phosphoribosyltransferase regulatory subunit
MHMNNQLLKKEERVMLDLRGLYRSYGYRPFKMNKFEEYDLYARNKDFLVSDGILSFTDTNGRLMALKPDVTLSIVKNTKDRPGHVDKVCYNENVYRVSRQTGAYREILQTGLECVGDLDAYQQGEVVMLAAESLRHIQPEFVLDISHMGLMMELINDLKLESDHRDEIIRCIGEKNTHEAAQICRRANADGEAVHRLLQVMNLSGAPEQVLEALAPLCNTGSLESAWKQLDTLREMLRAAGFTHEVQFDFSVMNNRHYYNGIVFQGFVSGAPNRVLSGGQYDKLLRKMGRTARAIGFAVYMDELERLGAESDGYDCDVLLLYDPGRDNCTTVLRMIQRLTADGASVRAACRDDGTIRCRRVIDLTKEAPIHG